MKIKILIQKKRDEKRIENMRIHAKAFGVNSIYYEDERFRAEYRKLLINEN